MAVSIAIKTDELLDFASTARTAGCTHVQFDYRQRVDARGVVTHHAVRASAALGPWADAAEWKIGTADRGRVLCATDRVALDHLEKSAFSLYTTVSFANLAPDRTDAVTWMRRNVR